MAKHDYEKDYWDKIHRWSTKKRAERKANENRSNFTILSMVGFSLGAGFFYHSPYVALGVIIPTMIGALLGAGIDYYQLRAKKDYKKLSSHDAT